MSLDALTWAFKLEVRPSMAKFVLVALADYASDKDMAFPSIETISNKTCMNRKTVIGHLDWLESKGLIRDTGKRVGATQQVKVFQLNCTKSGTVPISESNGTKSGVERYQKRDTEPSVNLRSEPPEGFEAFWKAYPNKDARKSAVKAFRKVRKEIQPTIMAALENHKRSEKWQKDSGAFVPHAATWLNGERWQDEVKARNSAQSDGHAIIEDISYRDIFRDHARSILDGNTEWPHHRKYFTKALEAAPSLDSLLSWLRKEGLSEAQIEELRK